MVKKNKHILGQTKKSAKEKPALKSAVSKALASIGTIKTGNVDALVISDNKNLKVYTQTKADDPYRVLIENMHEGAVTLNQDGTILYCNFYFSTMIKQPLQKVIGTKFINFLDDNSRKSFKAMLKAGRKNAIQEEVSLNTGNRPSPALMSINSLTLDNNILSFIILTDLTTQNKYRDELKQRAEQLEKQNIKLEIANRNLTTFTYVSSHDLQEPLRKIQTFVGCLLDEEMANLSDHGKMYLQRTAETATRMRSLIEDLLVYSRTTNDQHQYEEIDLNSILAEVANDFKEELLEKNATIDIGALCRLKIIRFQFFHIFHNLISNSLKFAQVNVPPRISIESEIVQGSKIIGKEPPVFGNPKSSTIEYCHIIYHDNGIGFQSEYKERIFEMFQRLHKKDQYPGTGIGLAVVKKVVENHDGIVTAMGEPGKGARFDIYIPT